MEQPRLQAARIRALYASARPAYFAELANAGILVALLWGPFSVGALLAWLALLLAVTLGRTALHWRFLRGSAQSGEAAAWKRRFVFGALASGAVWALGVSVFFPNQDPLRQMALVFVAGGNLIAAAGIYSASRSAVYAFSALPFSAMVFELLSQAGETYRLVALVVAVFGAVMWKVHLETHRGVRESLRIQLANEALLEHASATEGRLRETLAALEQRLAAEQELKAHDAMYRNLVETSSELIWSLDREGRWTFLNAAGARRIYGREAGELIGRAQREVVARELAERDQAVFERILAGEAIFDHETRHQRSDGGYVDLSVNAIPLRDGDGEVIGATGTARDVTEQKRAAAALQESVEKLRLAVEAADLRYWEWDAANGAPGFPAQEHDERMYAEDRERCQRAWREALEHGEPFEVEYRVGAPLGEVVWFSSRAIPVLDAGGKARRMIGVSQDITARKRREEAVQFLAYHDPLTGLPNRRLLDDRLKQALYAAQRRQRPLAVMLIDLDGFKRVNDSLGHRAGDSVLREVAERLAGCVRKVDTLARQGGDEFAIVISDVQSETDCGVVAEKILRGLEKDFRVEGESFSIGASMGISLFPADAGDGDALLRNADAAMYRAKQLGRNRYCFYRQ
jgi:diguanylate cyclase (GGDEF)-like protein/PAS domain S-box-containing protein